MQQLEAAPTLPTPCQYSLDRHRNLAKWRNLWTILIFAFGAAVIAFAIIAIFLLGRAQWLPGAISTLGALAGGTSTTWVLQRRGESVKEEEQAYEDVKRACQNPGPADQVRKEMQLLGKLR